MESFEWVLLTFFVLVLDLVIGFAIGWRLGRAAGEEAEATVGRARLDRTIRSINELSDAARLIFHQTDDYMTVVNQVGAEFAALPAETKSTRMNGLLESLQMMRPEMEQRRANFNRQLELSQASLSPQRREAEAAPVAWRIELVDGEPKSRAAAVDSPPESRREQRQSYRCRQMVAPYSFDHIPTRNRFEAVECLDISKRGIAYFTPTRPTSEMVVITTGDAPDLVYRTARIVSVQEMPADEAPGFRVGCEFIGRLSRHLF